jgi:hypothetical protein
MKLIIAGSRNLTDMELLKSSMGKFAKKHPDVRIDEIVSGTASGPDTAAILYAKENNIPVKKFPAEWDKYGKSAGPIRNAEMAKYADGLVAIWDGKSRGTRNMIENIKNMGKPFEVFTLIPNE